MTNRPSPALFAKYSYYASWASLAAILIMIVLTFFGHGDVIVILANTILWLTVAVSSVGTFLGYAARADFKNRPGEEEAMKQANLGFRYNGWAAAATLLFGLFTIIVRFLLGSGR